MGQALTLLFAVLLLGGGPVAEDAPEDGVQAEIETDLVEAQADTDGLTGNTSVTPKPGPTDAEGSVEASVSSGDSGGQAKATLGEGQVNVSLSPVEMNVRLSEGEVVELSYTPPVDGELLEDELSTATVDDERDDEAETTGSQQAAADEGGTELGWTIAPAAGLAAAAAAGHALPVGRWARRILGLAPIVPLFSRIQPDELLEHEAREAIYELLDDEAGLSLESICDELDLARSTARHHVRKLEQAGMIDHTRMGRARVHHLVGERGRAVREHLLTNETREAVYAAIEDEALTITGIAERIEANPGSVHFHLGKLAEADLVDTVGEEDRRYRATAPEEPARARA